jgi:negative regulator of flagellin synthesis FlgM
MKIGSGTPLVNVDTRLNQQSPVVNETAKDEDLLTDAAKVSLSSSATTIKQIQDELANVPDVRMEKVEQIKAEIAAGSYSRSPDEIASKMIVSSLVESLYK